MENNLHTPFEADNSDEMNIQSITRFIKNRHWKKTTFLKELEKMPHSVIDGKKEHYSFSYGHLMEVLKGKKPITARLKRGFAKLKEKR